MRPLLVLACTVGVARADPEAITTVVHAEHGSVTLERGVDLLGLSSKESTVTGLGATFVHGSTELLLDARYGTSTDGDRFGDLSLAGLARIAPRLSAGVATRLRADLARDDDDSPNEIDWQLGAGPLVRVDLGRLQLTGAVGLVSQQLRLEERVDTGAGGSLAVGTTF